VGGGKTAERNKLSLFVRIIAVEQDDSTVKHGDHAWRDPPCVLIGLRLQLRLVLEYICVVAIVSRRPEDPTQGGLFTYSGGVRSFELRDLLLTFHDFQCQDFHDRVYGLLNLAKTNARVPVDYGKSRHELYLDVVQKVLETEPQLEHDHFIKFGRWIELRWNLDMSLVQSLISDAFWTASRLVDRSALNRILDSRQGLVTLEDLRAVLLLKKRSS
jgi:hypothetical protein